MVYGPFWEVVGMCVRKASPPLTGCGLPKLTSHDGKGKETCPSEEEEGRKSSGENEKE